MSEAIAIKGEPLNFPPSPSLKYLFEAHFRDGSMYEQSPDNTPKISPTGSSFTDILARIDDVTFFGIFDPTGQFNASVNLSDGSFCVNGQHVIVGDPSLVIPEDTKYRLVYFRRNTREFQLGEQTSHTVVFHIGWQITIDGVNHQQTIAFI